MTVPPATDPRERVELTEHEIVVARGHEKVIWYVRQGRSWTAAAHYPGAEVLERDPRPGVVWDRAVVLSLPRGTELMRVELRPRAAQRRDPMEYLRREVRGAARSTWRAYYVIESGGSLRRRT